MLSANDNELIRTNRVLMGVSVVAVVLLGPSFILGYLSGYHTGHQDGPRGDSGIALAASRPDTPTSPLDRKPSKRAARTVPSAKVIENEPTPASPSGHPAAGQLYLQLVTAAKNRSAAIIDALRSGGFPVIASDVPEKPSLHRVLIGPLHEREVEKTRAELQSKGFPGDSAIERVF